MSCAALEERFAETSASLEERFAGGALRWTSASLEERFAGGAALQASRNKMDYSDFA
ncbi:hypothetical protein D1AOALGA4SA_6750 [Olavius algarvensis Delta 1 endosymbiont]|nr:hypothetical protein D1AOALGA4SA_6750 [Olavius algarvensis Delta 1 endosymbiont]